MTYRITSPTGEVRTGLTEIDVSNFKKSKQKKGIDPKAAGYKLEVEKEYDEQEETEKQPTTREQRREAFGNDAEYWPNVAEEFLKGNTGFNLGTLKAGIGDFLSLPGRTISAYANHALSGGDASNYKENFNLGTRSEESGNMLDKIARDPVTPLFSGGGRLLAEGVGIGANVGNKVLGLFGKGAGKVGEKIAASNVSPLIVSPSTKIAAEKAFNLGSRALENRTLGRSIGGAVAGAGEGALTELLDSEMNNREPDYLMGASLGGAFEGAGQIVQNMLRSFGENLVKASVAAIMKGNVNANVTNEEIAQFLKDPKNVESLKRVLEQQSRGRNALPFSGSDRGKTLQGDVNNAMNKAINTIADEKVLKNSPDAKYALYDNKTLFNPGVRNAEDYNYQREIFPIKGETDYIDRRSFKNRSGKKLTRDYGYQSNAEYNLEKFADKYAGMMEDFNNVVRISERPISKDEQEFIDFARKELEKDSEILKGYSPIKVLNSNKFLGDKMPFSSRELNRRIEDLKKAHSSEGLSKDFINTIKEIQTDATEGFGKEMSDMINSSFNGSWNMLDRAFAYADPKKAPPIAIRKELIDPINKFADYLDEKSVKSVGEIRYDRNGKPYSVRPDVDKYYFSYLAKIQDALRNIRNDKNLRPENLVGIYNDARMVNDVETMDKILEMMKEIGISKSGLENFKKKAANYSNYYKARKAMENAKQDNPVKGTLLNMFVPQEGFNFKNSLGYNLQGKNINLDNLDKPKFNSSKTGKISRFVYNLGRYPALNGEKKDK